MNPAKVILYAEVAAGAVAIVAVIYALRKFQQGAAAVTAPVAEWYASRNAVKTLSEVRLPSGVLVTTDAIVKAGSSVDGAMNFAWAGQRYHISHRGFDGIYVAVAI